MSQNQFQEIFNLSRDEKIELVQMLWDDISEHNQDIDIPDWQLEELDRRMQKIDDNTATYKSWDELKTKYMSIT